jgi:hypothetical protein
MKMEGAKSAFDHLEHAERDTTTLAVPVFAPWLELR